MTFQSLFMNRIQRHLFDVNAANNARFPFPLFKRIDMAVKLGMMCVFARDLVQLLHDVVQDDFHFTAEFDVTCRILGIYDEQGYFRVAEHIPALLAFSRSVDANTLTIIIAPYQARLRLSVGHHGCENAVDGTRN
jgi:hypothetical protein